MYKNILLAIFILSASSSFAQLSKKEVIEHKVKSVAEWETDLRSRKSKPIQESYTKYDAKGRVLELIERDNEGLIKLHESYEYDANGNKTLEIQYQPDGSIKRKHVYKYVNGLRTERLSYDKRGNLITEKKYIYEFQEN